MDRRTNAEVLEKIWVKDLYGKVFEKKKEWMD